MKKIYLVILVTSLNLFFNYTSVAQKQIRCGTDDNAQAILNSNPEVMKIKEQAEKAYGSYVRNEVLNKTSNGTRYIIPVVVHIIYKPGDEAIGTGSNVDDETVYKQIATLNKAYRGQLFANPSETDAQIEFRLASRDPDGNCHSGIIRVKSAESVLVSVIDTIASKSIKRLSHWPANKYLNLYVVNAVKDFLGYSSFPWNTGSPKLDSLDGVVIGHDFFGSTNNDRYYLGHTAVHEIGHWLGLYHTFQHDCINGGYNCKVKLLCENNPCSNFGDKVCDTPPVALPNFIKTPCDTIVNSCNSELFDTTTLNPFRSKALGGLGDQNDMFKNYMDYADDICMQLFTPGQLKRMNFYLQGLRASVWKNSNVTVTGAGGLLHDFDSVRSAFALNGKVKAMVEWPAKRKLIVAGDFTMADGIPVNGLAEWNGTKWDSLVAVPKGMTGQILALAVYGGELYVGGTFNISGQCKFLAKTSGSKFTKVTSSAALDATDANVNALCVSGSKLYVGGDFARVDGSKLKANRVASWDGAEQKWDSLRGGLFGNSAACYALCNWNNSVVVCGRFVKAGNLACDKIAVWSGSNWTSLNTGTNVTSGGRLNVIGAFGDKLYCGGDYSSVGGTLKAGLSEYNGTSWSSNVSSAVGSNRYAIEPFNGYLWVGGYVSDVGTYVSHIYTYSPAKDSMVAVSKKYKGFDAPVNCMTQFNGELYIGGDFIELLDVNGFNNKIVHNICKVKTYCIGNVSTGGMNEQIKPAKQMSLFPNPTTGRLTIENAKSEIRVYNLLGQEVYSCKKISEKTEIDVSSFVPGIYFVVSENGVRKFVKN